MNLTNLILQNSYVVLLILGMLPVILTGNVDLSVGSVLAFVGAVAAILQVNYGMGVVPTLLISLIVGIAIGAWQGMWIAYFDIPAFLVTLSGELVFRGLTPVSYTHLFVPASQTGVPKGGDLGELVKKTVQLRLTEVNRARHRVVGSIRAVASEQRKAAQEKIWSEIEVGKHYHGCLLCTSRCV